MKNPNAAKENTSVKLRLATLTMDGLKMECGLGANSVCVEARAIRAGNDIQFFYRYHSYPIDTNRLLDSTCQMIFRYVQSIELVQELRINWRIKFRFNPVNRNTEKITNWGDLIIFAIGNLVRFLSSLSIDFYL